MTETRWHQDRCQSPKFLPQNSSTAQQCYSDLDSIWTESLYKKTTNFDYRCPQFSHTLKPLTSALAREVERVFRKKRLRSSHMITVKPHRSYHSANWLEKKIFKLDQQYFEQTGESLRCAGFVSHGPTGQGRAEAHLIFVELPNWKLFKKLAKKLIGSVVVTGKYDSDEQVPRHRDDKNSPPHRNVIRYCSQHASYPQVIPIWLNIQKPRKRKLPVMVKTFPEY